MKISHTAPALLLGIAATVTAGSVYVTVQAAAQQEENAFAVPEVEVAQDVEAIPMVEEIPAEDVLHSRGHYVLLDEQGAFTAKLVGLTDDGEVDASGLTVKLIKDGAEIAKTSTSAEGKFSVSGLPEGTVGILAYGNGHFLLFSANLRLASSFEEPPALQEVVMTTAVTSGADAETVKQLVYGNVHSDWRFQGAVTDPEQVYPEGLVQEPSTAVSHHDVLLQPDGSLIGQVNLLDFRTGRHREIKDLTVHFVRGGEIVGSTVPAAGGEFRMEGLAPGIYSIATTGRDGVLGLGVNLVSPALAQNDSRYRLTSVAQSLDLAVAPVNPGNFQPEFVEDSSQNPEGPIADLPPISAPFGPGGFGPGGIGSGAGGGGAGAGGGGGLGALLGAAAGAGIGYALADDDDDPSSPNR